MFKKIPGNNDYRINLSKEIIDSSGTKTTLDINRHEVSIEMFGKVTTMSKRFLAALSWYEGWYIHNLELHIDKIKFYPVDSKILRLSCGYLMGFTEPVLYRDGFRFIPSYPRYAIDINSVVVDTFENVVIGRRALDNDRYEGIYIYNPDRNGYRWTRIHRLMALAWLPNDDFETRPFVNHLDGVRDNNRLENLEWCSLEENARHALATGLTNTQMKMKSRDIRSGEIVVYDSAAEMARKLGTTSIAASAYKSKLPGYLFNKRYEIKCFEDETPWYYASEDEDCISNEIAPSKAMVTITVLNKETGKSEKFINLKAFRKTYGIWTPSPSVKDSVAAFKTKFPNFEISYHWNAVKGPYRVINMSSKETFIFNAIHEAAFHIGRTRTELQYDLSRNFKFIYSEVWIVIPGFNDFDANEYKEKQNYFCSVIITKDSDLTEKTARSMKHAAKVSGIDYKSVVKYIGTGISIKGMKFRAVK